MHLAEIMVCPTPACSFANRRKSVALPRRYAGLLVSVTVRMVCLTRAKVEGILSANTHLERILNVVRRPRQPGHVSGFIPTTRASPPRSLSFKLMDINGTAGYVASA